MTIHESFDDWSDGFGYLMDSVRNGSKRFKGRHTALKLKVKSKLHFEFAVCFIGFFRKFIAFHLDVLGIVAISFSLVFGVVK